MNLPQLGKRAPRDDDRDLKLARFTPQLLTPPAHVKLSAAVKAWPDWWNYSLGDCAIEDPAHKVELVTTLGQLRTVVPSALEVLAAYEAVGGYRPADAAHPTPNDTDRGCVMGDVQDYLRTTGIGGHRSEGYARVSLTDATEIRQAVAFFGGLHLGLALPVSAQAQIGATWKCATGRSKSPKYAPGGWGGHAVLVTDYDSTGLRCITWGTVQRMTWGFFHTYADEAFVSLWPEWFGAGPSPQGIGADALRAALASFS